MTKVKKIANSPDSGMVEYNPGTVFPGVIGRTIVESSPAWPAPMRAKEGAPNVLFIVLDDTGFGQIGCYGSPINNPNITRLAENALRYTNMHTTALCSPTCSCIITGRNHHSIAMSCITEGSEGYPGSNGQIPFENGFLSETLSPHGYNTYAVGKWNRGTYRGGVSDPFILHWPNVIHTKGGKGGIRTQFAHAIDMVPTMLECLSIDPPEQNRGVTQSPIEGASSRGASRLSRNSIVRHSSSPARLTRSRSMSPAR